MTDLIYCAAGNKRYASIALAHGFRYGAQLPATIYEAPYFVDQNWKKPDRARYMAALAEHRPALATVLDWERDDQREEVMSWAEEAAQYAGQVLIIPKVCGTIDSIPHTIAGKPVRLAYSVPTAFGGTPVPTWEFGRRPVHLLGGSPHEQLKAAQYMNVVSADGNYVQKMANRNQFWVNGRATWAKNRYFPTLAEMGAGALEGDTNYTAFRLSLVNMRAAWLGAPGLLRLATENDLSAIKKVSNQYKAELGYVMLPALRESIARRSLMVAEHGGQVAGFVNYRTRRDGVSVVYELAVGKAWRGQKLGAALLEAVPMPRRLKCTTDNSANAFYEARGMVCAGREDGRKRPLNVWITR